VPSGAVGAVVLSKLLLATAVFLAPRLCTEMKTIIYAACTELILLIETYDI